MPQPLSNVLVHLVFSTKRRNPRITPTIRRELNPYLTAVLKNHDCPALQIGGVEDHVHVLLQLSRKMSIAEVVEKVKTSSSKWAKPKDPEFAWQAGYGAFSVSPFQSDGVIGYIQDQEAHHRGLSFQDEYRELLRLAGMALDERYAWD